MNPLFYSIFSATTSLSHLELAWCFIRIGVGLFTIAHGAPKMLGGLNMWHTLGTTFMPAVGIYFWPVIWGFLGASTEFLGGIMMTIGFGTRIASFALVIMMIIATTWHIKRGDSFNLWSFPATLIIIYLAFMFAGSDRYSIDYLITR